GVRVGGSGDGVSVNRTVSVGITVGVSVGMSVGVLVSVLVGGNTSTVVSISVGVSSIVGVGVGVLLPLRKASSGLALSLKRNSAAPTTIMPPNISQYQIGKRFRGGAPRAGVLRSVRRRSCIAFAARTSLESGVRSRVSISSGSSF